jgi:hypothetical protein
MLNIGRNDPCPCGSGKKFKKCHMGREEDLVLEKLQYLPEEASKNITSLPEVDYGHCQKLLKALDWSKLAQSEVGIKFVDLKSYLNLGYAGRQAEVDLNRTSAGQMINPMKTLASDPDHIYIAVSPAISDSTLIHELAHALDYLAGSKNNPGAAKPLSMELEAPLELLEHPKEFGDWLIFLKNELAVELNAEDAIVAFLQETGNLIPGEILAGNDHEMIGTESKRILRYVHQNRDQINEKIKNLEGYQGDKKAE